MVNNPFSADYAQNKQYPHLLYGLHTFCCNIWLDVFFTLRSSLMVSEADLEKIIF